MAEQRLVLGQLIPAASTVTNLYTVPGLTQAVVSTISACEQAGGTPTINISVAPGGAGDALAQYIVYGAQLQANESKFFTVGVTMGPSDVIRVTSSSGNVAFSAFGVQLT